MLPFKKIDISDKKRYDEITRNINSMMCAHYFVDLFIWRVTYNTKICFEGDFVFIKQRLESETVYTIPLGNGDLTQAIELLKQDAEERNVVFHLAAVNENQKNLLEAISPGQYEFNEERDSEDYIYLAENLMTLAGKKLHSKRNFINRFVSTYENSWSYENINEENLHEVFNFHLSWCALNENEENRDFFGETCAISLALKNFEELGLKGGLIRIDGQVIAFTLGFRASEDLFIVNIEKADHTIAGAYQMINNQFAVHNFEGVKYVNREEDLGKEGLRRAKLSYYPEMLGQNFTAFLK